MTQDQFAKRCMEKVSEYAKKALSFSLLGARAKIEGAINTVFDRAIVALHLDESSDGDLSQDPPENQRAAIRQTRSWVVDFGPVDIAPGEIAVVKNSPQVLFRGEKIIVDESVAGSTLILFYFVGVRLQSGFVPDSVDQGTPSSLYHADVVDNHVYHDVLEPGLAGSFFVKNISDKPVQWRASIIGKTTEVRIFEDAEVVEGALNS